QHRSRQVELVSTRADMRIAGTAGTFATRRRQVESSQLGCVENVRRCAARELETCAVAGHQRDVGHGYAACRLSDAARSASAVVSGWIPKGVPSRASSPGVRKAGGVGPSRTLPPPSDNSVRNTATAFCSNHDTISDSGSSLTPHPNALASAWAITRAE